MKSNYTTEEVNDLVDELIDFTFTDGRSPYHVDNFKKSHGLIPTLEVGKWNVWDDDEDIVLWRITEVTRSEIKGYGFLNNEWNDECVLYRGGCVKEATLSLVEATTEEVETALIAEAKKRGFKDGVLFNCALTPRTSCDFTETYNGEHNKWEFDSERNTLSRWANQYLFHNGKWSTIVTPKVLELTMSEVEDKYGCKVKIIKE